MANKSVDQKILDLQVSLKQTLVELKKMTQEGTAGTAEYEKLRAKFQQIFNVTKQVENSINRSYGQTKNVEVYNKRLQSVVSTLNSVKTAQNQVTSAINKQGEAAKRNIKEEQALLRSSIKEGNARRTAALKEFEARQKSYRKRRIARQKQLLREEVAAEKKAIREKLQAEKAAAKEANRIAAQRERERLKAQNRGDFRGGLTGQFTPRAVGGALGSLVKYLGLYRALNVAAEGFTEITIGSVKQAIIFEKALANLGAVAGATAKEVQMMGKNALEVAGATKFTAEEIVGLQTELSKLGFTAEEVVASTKAIAFTAQALGSPLNTTAEQVGKVINQFNLLVEQAGYVGDVLVTAINNSALSFDSFSTAIQYVGPIAQNLGLTFEQTAGAMGVLADNGFTASRIGTGLRGILTELAKTSVDAEQSLRDLAEQHISLSEAVELVGKRNAAQLITLLKNIDALDEGTGKYYEAGRAFEAAAKQANTWSGQMEILTSNFREFQIQIGTTIAESDALLRVMDALFPKGAETARAFKAISEVGFQKFSKGANEVVDGASALDVALELLGISMDEYTEAVTDVAAARVSTIPGSTIMAANATKTMNAVNGLVDALSNESKERLRNTAIQEGQLLASSEYEEAVQSLIDSFNKGNVVNKEADELYESLGSRISELTAEIEKGMWISDEQKTQYEAAIKTLEGYQDQVNNTILSEQELADRRQKIVDNQSKEAQAEIERIKKDTKARIDAANELAKQEEAIAEGAEAKAAVEADRAATVRALYIGQAEAIGQLADTYKLVPELIEENVRASEKLARVLGSELISDVGSAYDNFIGQIKDAQDALENGIMSQEAYEDSVAELRDGFLETIGTFKSLFGTTPEVDKFFDNLVMGFDEASIAAKKTDEAVKESKKTFEDFVNEFKEDGYLDVIRDAFAALGESLDEFNKTQAMNTENRLRSELDAIKNRYDIEGEILRSQLDNQLITESQFRQKQIDLRKAQIAEENTIEGQIFEARKKQDKQDAILEGIEAAAQSYVEAFKAYEPLTALLVGSIGASIASVQTSAQVSAINQRKFYGKKFEDGGIVDGPSHANGGVPFTVQGRGGYEMEGGEFIVNKSATTKHRDLLERINASTLPYGRGGKMKFATGGMVGGINTDNSVDYLKVIAEASMSTATNTSKPVRAFVSKRDLVSDSSERRIRDRNDRV